MRKVFGGCRCQHPIKPLSFLRRVLFWKKVKAKVGNKYPVAQTELRILDIFFTPVLLHFKMLTHWLCFFVVLYQTVVLNGVQPGTCLAMYYIKFSPRTSL